MKVKCTSGEETVYTRKDLREAVLRRQEKIVIMGDLANKVYKDMNGRITAKRFLGAACAVGTFAFAPLAIPALGLLFSENFSDYKMMEYWEDKVVLELTEDIIEKAVWR